MGECYGEIEYVRR